MGHAGPLRDVITKKICIYIIFWTPLICHSYISVNKPSHIMFNATFQYFFCFVLMIEIETLEKIAVNR